MSPANKEIHETCLKLCSGYVKREAPIVLQLQRVGESTLLKELGIKNLYKYAVEVWGLSEGSAYSFIAVAKATILYPSLKEAIASRTLTVSKANRIVSILNFENARELVEFSINNSARKIEREVRKRNPKASVKAKIKPLSEDTDLLCTPISRKTTDNIERAQALLAQKTSRHQGLPETLQLVFEDYVERHDPVRKAERAKERIEKKTMESFENTNAINEPQEIYARAEKNKRVPLTAEQKHLIDLRDKRKCCHLDHNNQKCEGDRWIHYHHIIPVANGGTNDPNNITTLCSFHHDLVHQLSLPIDGQITWLRSPRKTLILKMDLSPRWRQVGPLIDGQSTRKGDKAVKDGDFGQTENLVARKDGTIEDQAPRNIFHRRSIHAP